MHVCDRSLRELCEKNFFSVIRMLTKFKIAAASSKSMVKHQSQRSDIKVRAKRMHVTLKFLILQDSLKHLYI